MSILLKGKAVADRITEELISQVSFLKKENIVPCLGIIRVGEKADDIAYERGASKRAEKVGIRVKSFILPADSSESEILSVIDDVNADINVHGVLLLRPLPAGVDEAKIVKALNPDKDVDGITAGSMAGIYEAHEDVFAPCTAEACIEILKHYDIDIEGKEAVVIGRSLVIGKPVSMLLQKENATVTMCHSKTKNLAEVTKRADIIVVASGKANTIGAEHVTDNQVILDVGINVLEDGNMCGDVDFAALEDMDVSITPVPGGVGSVTTSLLCKHVVIAAEGKPL